MRNHPENRPVLVRWPKPKVNMLGVSPAGLRRMLLQAVGGAALLLWDVDSAWAACSPAAANSVVAICSGAISSQYGSGVETGGDITVDAGTSWSVAGSYALYFGSLTNVANSGTISATAPTNTSAYAIYAATTATVNNFSGATIGANSSGTGAAAHGVYVRDSTGTISSNAGTIYGSAGTASAYGIFGLMTDANLIVTSNTGDIRGVSSGTGVGTGIYAVGSSVVIGTNAGTITGTSATGNARGVLGNTYVSITTNSGTIKGQTSGSASTTSAYGVAAAYSDITINNNSGLISGASTNTSGTGAAYGLYAIRTGVNINANTGVISAAVSGSGAAYGLYAAGSTATIYSNTGTVYGFSASGAAYGLYSAGASANITITTNTQDIYGTSLGDSRGAGIYAYASNVTVGSNSGNISGSSATGNAFGVRASTTANINANSGIISGSSGSSGLVYGVYAGTAAYVTNSSNGEISGTSLGSGSAYGTYGADSVTINGNGGTIKGTSATGNAFGAYAGASALTVISNGGNINGVNTGSGSSGSANGLVANASSISISANTGTISASAAGSGVAYGVNAATFANITNSSGGSISGASGTGSAYGVKASTIATVSSNSGTISGSNAGSGLVYGVVGSTASVGNASGGLISGTSTGSGTASGVFGSSSATVTSNAGSIMGSSATGYGYGVYGASVTVANAGAITGSSIDSSRSGLAFGLQATSGAATVTSNAGTISAMAAGSGAAYGVSAWTDATVTNASTGSITATSSGGGEALGVFASWSATVTNSGLLSATGTRAYGVQTQGDMSVTNFGRITTVASTGVSIGLYDNGGFATLKNSGFVESASQASAYGVSADTADVTNSGSITAASSAGGSGFGVWSFEATVINSGTITASSASGAAYGVYGVSSATIASNAGNLTATSGTGAAFGVYSASAANVTNTGAISASSSSGDTFGIYGGSDVMANLAILHPGSYSANATLDNALNVSASTAGPGKAYGLYGGTYATLTNRAGATLSAIATGSGNAYGLQAGSYATVSNAATASISASSVSGNAYAVRSNDASTSINNSGSISATSASGLSYGLYLSGGAASITNTNTGAISGQTASVYAGAQVANVLNWQGGNAADAKSSALTWSGTLPGQYTLGVRSPTRYGQIWFSNPSGTMAVNLDSSSTLALGSYAKAVTGVNASAISSATGTLGSLRWQLSLSDSSNLYWDLLVTPNGMATGETKLVSALNQSFMPYFFGGTLQLDANTSTVSDNFVLDASSTNTVALGGNSATFSGVWSDAAGSAGRVSFGGGTAVLTGTNTYSGGTGIDSNTVLQIGNGGTTGTIGSGAISNSGTLAVARSNAYTLANAISGSGRLRQLGSGTTTLTGTNTYTGTTTISAGTLQVGNGGTSGSLGSGQVTNNAALVFNRSDSLEVLAGIAGTGNLFQLGVGTTTLTGTNTYTGTTTISAGTLQVGNGGTSGSLGTGAVVNNATLRFNRSDAITVSNTMSGSGTLVQQGSGALTLNGVNSYAAIDNQSTIASLTNYKGGSGSGSASSALQYSGALPTNYWAYLTSPTQYGQLSVTTYSGSMGFGIASGSTLTPGRYASVLNGISASALSGANFGMADGNLWVLKSPSASSKQWDLVVSSLSTGNGTVLQASNWANGVDVNLVGGTLSLDLGGIFSNRIQLQGANVSTLQLNGNTTELSGTIVNASGASGLILSGAGTAVLSGTNTYTGSTTIAQASTLQIGNGGTTGTIGSGAISNSGTLAVARSNAYTLANDVSGSGSLQQTGSGTTVLTGTNTYTGTTTISAGTLQVGNGSTSGSLGTGAVLNNGTLAFERSDAALVPNAISGSGELTQKGAGTLILSADNNYSGGTTISAGTLQIGNGASTGTIGSGTVSNQGLLRVWRTGTLALDMRIQGSGSLALDGGGITTLGGANSFSGGIAVASGSTLAIANSAALGSGPVALVGSSTVPAYFKVTGSTSIANPISVQGDPVFDVAPGATVSITAPITDGASPGDVVVQGGGTLAFLAANTYSGPTAIVAGSALELSGAGSIAKSSSVSNQGKLDLRGVAGHGVSLAQFSQGATGQLLMRTSASAAQLLSVAGTANLNGTLAISAQPGNYKSGIFKLISADQVSGAFSSITGDLGNYVRTYALLYGPQGVDLEMVVGPDAANSRQALGTMASAQAALMKQRNQLLSDLLSQECLPSQAGQSCIAVQGRYGRSTMGNEGTGLISGAWQVSPTLRMGGFVEQGDVKLRNGGVGFSSNAPNLGAFLRWNANTDGSGLQARVSFASHIGSLQMTRDKTLADTEAGSGMASLQSYALGAELAWAIPVGANTVLKPYLGLQDTRSQRGAYTEASAADVAYPISYEAFEHNNLYTIAGLRMSGIASDRFSYQLSGGLQYKEKRYGSDLSGSSPIYKLDAFALDMRDTSANPEFVGSADVRYHFGKDQQVTAGLALRGPISDAPQVFKATLGYQVSF